MADRAKRKHIPPPPPEGASDKTKAKYCAKHDAVALLDAGYLEEDGIFVGDKRVVDLRPERGLVAIPVRASVARKLYLAARRSRCTPSALATRWLARELQAKVNG
jgi:hypothetical protein